MKKIMMTIAAIVCAAGVQAANVDWSIDIGYAAGSGYTAYAVTELLAFTGVSTGDASIQSVLLGTGDNIATFDDCEEYWGASSTTVGLTDAAGSTKDFFIVVVNKDNTGYWTFATSGEVYTTSTEPTMAYVDAMETVPSTSATTWKTSPGPTPGPVPEPTSGLLLLVGMAGLALRRRRA